MERDGGESLVKIDKVEFTTVNNATTVRSSPHSLRDH